MLARLHLGVVLLVLGACNFHNDATQSDDAAPPAQIPNVDFETASSGADEKSGTVMIPIVLSVASETAVDVTYSVTGGTATPGSDFTVSSSVVTFGPGELTKSIPVTIADDTDEQESNETIELGIVRASGGVHLGTTTTHTITISNHILPRVQFDILTSTNPEPTQTLVMLMLDKPAESAGTVAIALSGSATPVVDYAITNNQLINIPQGSMGLMVPIGEVNDALNEDDETVILMLKNPSPGLLVGTKNLHTHTIANDDPAPTIGFATPVTRTVDEAVGTTTLTVALSAPSGKTITVTYDFDTNLSTATNTTDATVVGAGGTLTFAPGETTKTIDVTVVDDALDEDDETVVVRLSNATNVLSISDPTFTVTISDNDATPSISFDPAQSDRTSNEGDPPSTHVETYDVVLGAASGRTVTAKMNFTGDATIPGDYTPSPTTLTFAPGVTRQTITLTIVVDNTNESDDQVIMTFNNVTNATVVSPSQRTHTIVDDD